MTTTEADMTGNPDSPPSTSDTNHRTPGRAFAAEAVIGVLIGLAVLAALVTGTAEIPFVYQGY